MRRRENTGQEMGDDGTGEKGDEERKAKLRDKEVVKDRGAEEKRRQTEET